MAWSARHDRLNSLRTALVLTTLSMAGAGVATFAAAQPIESPLVGIWRITGWEAKQPNNQVLKAYGEHPGGHWLFSKNGRVMFLIVGEDRKPPSALPPPAAEIARLFATMSAYDASYRVEGSNTVIMHVENAWAPSWVGTSQERTFKIDGNRLTITATVKNPNTGESLDITVTGEREE